MSDSILTSSDGKIFRITLNRPEVSNSVDLETAAAFEAAVQAAAADPAGVVLLSGNGRLFCAGGDVGSMLASDEPQAYLNDLAVAFDAALLALAALEKPVVAAVQGAAAGAGLAVALASDVIVAGEKTKFLTAYGDVGLTPDCGLSYLLPRAIGQQRALELLLTGRVLDAATAQSWGLATEVVADDTVQARAEEIATLIANGPAWALGQAKRLVRTSWEATRADSGQDEARTIAQAVVTPEAQKLMERFKK